MNHGAVGLGDVFSLPVGAVSSQSREITMYSNKEKENFTERQERNSIPIMDSLGKRWREREKRRAGRFGNFCVAASVAHDRKSGAWRGGANSEQRKKMSYRKPNMKDRKTVLLCGLILKA